MAAPQFRPLGFGEILDGAFTLYRRNFVPLLLTALIPSVLIVAGFAVVGTQGVTTDPQDIEAGMRFAVAMLGYSLVAGLVSLVLWAALTREAAQAYLGHPVSVGDGMRTAFRKLLPLLGAAILMFVAMLVTYFVVVLLVGIVVAVGMATGNTALMVILGVVATIVGIGAFLGMASLLFAVIPAIVVEDRGPLQSFGRSFDLARGALGRVAGLMVVSFIIVYLPVIAVAWLTGGFASFSNPQAMPSMGQFLTQQLLSGGVGILTTPFLVSVIVLLYFDRRVRTEALDVQMMTDRLAGAGL